MPTISFVSSKGGVGKSTATCALAGEIAWQLRQAGTGKTVGLIDADKNQHSKGWFDLPNTPENITYYQTNEENLIDVIEQSSRENLFTFIDSAGEAKDETQLIVSQSDLVMVMSQASIVDTKETIKTVKMIRGVEKMCSRSIKHAVLLTNTDPAINTKLGREITDTVSAAGVRMFNATLVRRQCFRQIFAVGGTFHTLYQTPGNTKQQLGSIDKGIENLQAVIKEITAELRQVNNNPTVQSDRELSHV